MKMTKMDIILSRIAFDMARNNDVLEEVFNEVVEKYGTEIISTLIDNKIVTFEEIANLI